MGWGCELYDQELAHMYIFMIALKFNTTDECTTKPTAPVCSSLREKP